MIQVFDRQKNMFFIEKVYGNKFIRFLYNTFIGKILATIITKKVFSKIYGALQNTRLSRRKIAAFIKNYEIDMEQFEVPKDGFKNFNQFFIRALKNKARIFIEDQNIMPAFAEGRYLGFKEIKDEQIFPVKGKFLDFNLLVSNSKWLNTFKDGPLLIARLCPVDYHRFHFPDDAEILDQYEVLGNLHSVNPVALKAKEDIFITNERHITILKTKNFGILAYIEVGATCVGKIIQSPYNKVVKRGEEKGYFLFGGSTVIVIGQKGAWTPDKTILEMTDKKIETYVCLGDRVGERF